jgi:protease I
VDKDKILAAICIAPAILAHGGVLKDKRATVWKSQAQALKANAAIYTAKPVQIDGKIITADGPKSAHIFGRKIAELLAQKKED